jgi:hypothetical protein
MKQIREGHQEKLTADRKSATMRDCERCEPTLVGVPRRHQGRLDRSSRGKVIERQELKAASR